MNIKQAVLMLSIGMVAYPSLADVVIQPPVMKSIQQQAQEHTTWVEVSRGALINNIREVRKALNSTQLCVDVKADAYGHGIKLIMPTLLGENIDCIAVGSNQEAQIARANRFSGQIIRARFATPAEIKEARQYNIEELVGNLEIALYIDQLASLDNKVVPVHLVLNSGGLGQNGLELNSDSGQKDAIAISKMRYLKIVGITTDYAINSKEEVEKGFIEFGKQTGWLFKNTQLDRNQIKLQAANDFAALAVPDAKLDSAKVGSVIYGNTFNMFHQFKNVMQFKSQVAAVNHYPSGSTVGEGHSATLKRDSKLANIPVGFADGYRSVFGNKAYVFINGHRVPVIGKVSMNTLMADVTDFPDIKTSDDVVLFGNQGAQSMTQTEAEQITDASLAELYTVWGQLNERVLVQ
ncbi:alanine racemase [Neisseria sp. Ec49-e6-T10]|uniref:alanine racemase n=1 Tax=Neisseria sp. Ec49-e6-T10 TaxID=3140744 RepID=UPI003EC134FE